MPKDLGDKKDKKRPAVKSRKASMQQAKGSRRRQRSGNGFDASHASQPYGSRTISKGTTQGLSITVQLPPLRRTPKGRAAQAGEGQQRPRKFFRPVAVIPIIVAVLGIALFTDIGRGSDNPAVPEASALRTEPSFLPLLPAAEESSATHYDAKRNLVSYTTSFSGSRITVSQQPIPENFKGDSNALSKAAEKISATQRVDTDRGPVYMYTNDKNGEQLAVHAGEGVLLFIRTDTALNESAWKSFIEQLQPKDWNGQG